MLQRPAELHDGSQPSLHSQLPSSSASPFPLHVTASLYSQPAPLTPPLHTQVPAYVAVPASLQVAVSLYSQFGPLTPASQRAVGTAVGCCVVGAAVVGAELTGLELGADEVGDEVGDELAGVSVGTATLGVLEGTGVVGTAVGLVVTGAADGISDGLGVMASLQSSPRWVLSQSQSPLPSTAPPPLQSTASLRWKCGDADHVKCWD